MTTLCRLNLTPERSLSLVVAGAWVLCAGMMAEAAQQQVADPNMAERSMAVSHTPVAMPFDAQNELVNTYCTVCHNDEGLAGNMSLETFSASSVAEHAARTEAMIRKLRAGMMPPSYMAQPDKKTLELFTASLEARIDASAETLDPGTRGFQRLNRVEYAHSVRDLLDLEIDATAYLPPDTVSDSFDNVADVQAMSPTLMGGYLRAADQISRDAVGEPTATARDATYKPERMASQRERVAGAPFGTRGGVSAIHHFPADGEYFFRVQLHGGPTGILFGNTVRDEQVEISINGKRVSLIDIDHLLSESSPNGLFLESERVFVKSGPQRVTAAFIERFLGPIDDLVAPIEHTLADSEVGRGYGVTTVPHLRLFNISGPYNPTGVSETPSRQKIFSCRPTSAADEAACAEEIITRLSREAYRKPVDDLALEGLMSFYQTGVTDGGFESGIRTALQAILASPEFVFRLEEAPEGIEAGEIFGISDLDLASRLSYFLWATAPDAELVRIASEGRLSDPVVLEEQARRLLADPRSLALSERFANQWLRLPDLARLHPDALKYPEYDWTLAQAMERETEMVFDTLIREDRSIFELLTADFTFVNERLARHYDIPNISGPGFRRIAVTDENRQGLLGHGSILTLTSVADRTSPVQRGKWILEVLLGNPPPPPPPDVEALEETNFSIHGRLLSVRERMEEHRANPACQSCHDVIDPLGLALENFDVTGAWRLKDSGVPVDATGEMYDGTILDGPAGLKRALLNQSDAFVLAFTESLLTYGLGRRVEHTDMPMVRALIKDAEMKDNRFSAFILGVVRSPAFRMNRFEKVGVHADAVDQ